MLFGLSCKYTHANTQTSLKSPDSVFPGWCLVRSSGNNVSPWSSYKLRNSLDDVKANFLVMWQWYCCLFESRGVLLIKLRQTFVNWLILSLERRFCRHHLTRNGPFITILIIVLSNLILPTINKYSITIHQQAHCQKQKKNLIIFSSLWNIPRSTRGFSVDL